MVSLLVLYSIDLSISVSLFVAIDFKLPKNDISLGGSPGLVVMGGDSCFKGHGFESRHLILDGHFSHKFVVKIVMMFV